MPRCQAITKRGTQCTRDVAWTLGPPAELCSQHAKIDAVRRAPPPAVPPPPPRAGAGEPPRAARCTCCVEAEAVIGSTLCTLCVQDEKYVVPADVHPVLGAWLAVECINCGTPSYVREEKFKDSMATCTACAAAGVQTLHVLRADHDFVDWKTMSCAWRYTTLAHPLFGMPVRFACRSPGCVQTLWLYRGMHVGYNWNLRLFACGHSSTLREYYMRADRPRALPDTELARLAANAQSVHADVVVADVKKYAGDYMKTPTKPGQDTLKDIIVGCKLSDRARKNFALKYYSDENIYDLGPLAFRRVADGLVATIVGHSAKTELMRRLGEELEDNSGMCSQGCIARLINVMAGFDPKMHIAASLQDEMVDLAKAADLTPDEKREKALALCMKHGANPDDWLPALEDFAS